MSSSPPPVAVTLGTFDGVHLGHRSLLEEAGRIAAASGLELVALTFDRHPLAVLRPEAAPRLLTGLSHKLELLAPLVANEVRVLAFDAVRAAQTPESFVRDTLAGELGARLVIVGENFRFGAKGAGDVATLTRVGATVDLEAVGVPLLEDPPGVPVSSTEIRTLLAAGELDKAARLLTRSHEVRGVLVGDATSHSGVAVLVPDELVLPLSGTYEALVGPVGSQLRPTLVTVADTAGPFATGPDTTGTGARVLRLGPLDEVEGGPADAALGGEVAVVFLATARGSSDVLMDAAAPQDATVVDDIAAVRAEEPTPGDAAGAMGRQ